MEALALLGVVTAPPTGVAVTSAVRYALSDSERRAVLRKAWRIRATWRRTAVRVGLFQSEHGAKVGAEVPLVGEMRSAGREKLLVPRIRSPRRLRVSRWTCARSVRSAWTRSRRPVTTSRARGE